MLRNLIPVFLLIILASSSFFLTERKKTITINSKDFFQNLPAGSSQGILISCNRCGCFDPVMSDFVNKDLKDFPQLLIAADTNCIKWRGGYHLSELQLDDLSEDFYNVILFRKKGNTVECRIVETREHIKFTSICRRFFK